MSENTTNLSVEKGSLGIMIMPFYSNPYAYVYILVELEG